METTSRDELEIIKIASAKLNSSLIDKIKSEFYNENGRNASSDSANATPSDLNYGNEYQHNFCVQTGEEFSPDFLRDSGMSRRNPFMNEVDCNIKNNQCSDVAQNHHHLAYEDLTGHPGSGTSDGSFSGKMKFLCSFSGRIFPRPNDGKLRYVGGEMKIISIRKNINYIELMRKTSGICNQLTHLTTSFLVKTWMNLYHSLRMRIFVI